MQTIQQPQLLPPELPQVQAEKDITEIVKRHAAVVYRTCYAVTRNSHDAEDAAQTTFIALAEQMSQGTEIRHISAWLQQVAHRNSLDLYRSRNRRRRREDVVRRESPTETAAVFRADRAEVAEAIQRELQSLPPAYRTTLILHYYGDLSSGQIARQLGCNAKALSMRLLRGRRMLAERLADRGVVLGAPGLSVVLTEVVRTQVASHASTPVVTAAMSSAFQAKLDGFAFSETFQALLRSIATRPRRAVFVAALFAGSALGGRSEAISDFARGIRNSMPDLNMIHGVLRQFWQGMGQPKLQRAPLLRIASDAPASRKDATSTAAVPFELNLPRGLAAPETLAAGRFGEHQSRRIAVDPLKAAPRDNLAFNDALRRTPETAAVTTPSIYSRAFFAGSGVVAPADSPDESTPAIVAMADKSPAPSRRRPGESISVVPPSDGKPSSVPPSLDPPPHQENGTTLVGNFKDPVGERPDDTGRFGAGGSASTGLADPEIGQDTRVASPGIPEPTLLAPLTLAGLMTLRRRRR